MLLHLAALLLFPTPTEEMMSFSFHALKYASNIVEVEIMDSRGTLKVLESYRGHLDSNTFQLDLLSSPSRFSDPAYTPSWNLVHQKCILFLREKDHRLVPAYQYDQDQSNTALAMSMVWVAGDSISYGQQHENPGPLYFEVRYTRQVFLEQIWRHNKSIHTFYAAGNQHPQEKAAILKESLVWTSLRDETIAELGKCGEYGLQALYELLPKEHYTHEQRQILHTYLESGKEQVLPRLDSIFQYEFHYWQQNMPALRGTEYWGSGAFDARYAYLSDLVYLLAEYERPDWRIQAAAVRDFFHNEPSYQPPSGWCRIDTGIDQMLQTRR